MPMPGMPGMSGSTAVSTWHNLLLLGLLALFWLGAVLHGVRLLAGPMIADRDPFVDAAHGVMGATMAYMLFPGTWTGPNRIAAGVYALGATAFAVRTLRSDRPGDPPNRRAHAAVIAISFAAMTAMLGVRAPSSALVGGTAAALLVCCAAAHLRILTHRHGEASGLDRGETRLLVLAPGLAAVATTLGMAYTMTIM
jgi:Domain of unknown function (DUF5134)